ncbi:MAG: MFS transporter, partial [Isosphaeraceae bacterium]|nr:MFS transporter [Isosphaeraceae bacterium]
AAFSPTLGVLMLFRALLGVGEAFNWPCALRVTGAILPPADRGLGNGIFNSGAAVGAVLTPLSVPILAEWFGWRVAFLAVGSLGFAWMIAWLAVVGESRSVLLAGRRAKALVGDELEHPPARLSAMAQIAFAGLAALAGVVALGAIRIGPQAIWWGVALLMVGLLVVARFLPRHTLTGVDWAESLGEIVRLRRFWIMALVSVTINVCWHFLVNWLPAYLQDDRGMAFVVGGMLSAIPFLAADVGNLAGGAASRVLSRRGLMPSQARAWVMAGCAVLISLGATVGGVRSNTITLLLLATMALGAAAFMANYFAFCQEVSARHTGLVVGILGGLGNLFAAGFSPLAGHVKDTTYSFAPIFVVVGLLPFVGLAALLLGWGAPAPEPEPEPLAVPKAG